MLIKTLVALTLLTTVASANTTTTMLNAKGEVSYKLAAAVAFKLFTLQLKKSNGCILSEVRKDPELPAAIEKLTLNALVNKAVYTCGKELDRLFHLSAVFMGNIKASKNFDEYLDSLVPYVEHAVRKADK